MTLNFYINTVCTGYFVILFNSLGAGFEMVSSTLCTEIFVILSRLLLKCKRLVASQIKGFKQGTGGCYNCAMDGWLCYSSNKFSLNWGI